MSFVVLLKYRKIEKYDDSLKRHRFPSSQVISSNSTIVSHSNRSEDLPQKLSPAHKSQLWFILEESDILHIFASSFNCLLKCDHWPAHWRKFESLHLLVSESGQVTSQTDSYAYECHFPAAHSPACLTLFPWPPAHKINHMPHSRTQALWGSSHDRRLLSEEAQTDTKSKSKLNNATSLNSWLDELRQPIS